VVEAVVEAAVGVVEEAAVAAEGRAVLGARVAWGKRLRCWWSSLHRKSSTESDKGRVEGRQ